MLTQPNRNRRNTAGTRKSRLVVAFFLLPLLALAQTPAAHPAAGTAEDRGTHEGDLQVDAARKNPLALRAFLFKMPKGADLHMHLTGAIYAETFIHDAIEDHLCVDTHTFAFEKPQAATADRGSEPTCASGQVPVSTSLHDPHLYNGMVAAFSIRSFVPSTGVSAHDHFFDAFAKFGGLDRGHLGLSLIHI